MRGLLALSMAVNVAAAALAVRGVYLRGGWEYLRTRFTGPASDSINPDEISFLHRQTLFERLPARERPIVFLGDSLTAGCEWGEFYPGALNRGIGGDTSAGLLRRLSTVTQHHPRVIFLMIGINDRGNLHGAPPDTARNIREALARIRQASPDTTVFLESLLPRRDTIFTIYAREVNQLIRQFADGRTVVFVDLYPAFLEGNVLNPKFSSDGDHLNGDGYLVWKERIDPLIKPYHTQPYLTHP